MVLLLWQYHFWGRALRWRKVHTKIRKTGFSKKYCFIGLQVTATSLLKDLFTKLKHLQSQSIIYIFGHLSTDPKVSVSLISIWTFPSCSLYFSRQKCKYSTTYLLHWETEIFQQSKDPVRFLVGLKNTKRFYMRVFEGEKDRYYWNKIVY